MGNSLMSFNDDGPRWLTTKQQREEAQQRQKVRDTVRLAGFKSDGVKALAAHNMKGMRSLDDHRQQVAGSSEALNEMCAAFEVDAFQQSRDIQRDVYNEWKM